MKRKTATIRYLDKAFREAIYESYDFICAYFDCPYCRNYSMRQSREIECAHYYNRYRASGRWHPDNCAALCHGAHMFLEHNKALEVQFFTKLLGEVRHDWLVERHQGIYRYKPWERGEMVQHYKAQEYSIRRRRVEKNEEGFIDLVARD